MVKTLNNTSSLKTNTPIVFGIVGCIGIYKVEKVGTPTAALTLAPQTWKF